MRKEKRAFTVVELVIVIAIIGVLAGIMIPTFLTFIQQTEDSALQQDLEISYTEFETDIKDGYLGPIYYGRPVPILKKEEVAIISKDITYQYDLSANLWKETERGVLKDYDIYNDNYVGYLSNLPEEETTNNLMELAFGSYKSDIFTDDVMGSWDLQQKMLGNPETNDRPYKRYQITFVHNGKEYSARYNGGKIYPWFTTDVIYYEGDYPRGGYIGEYNGVYLYESGFPKTPSGFTGVIKPEYYNDGYTKETARIEFNKKLDSIYDAYKADKGETALPNYDVSILYSGKQYIKNDLHDWFEFPSIIDETLGTYSGGTIRSIDRATFDNLSDEFDAVYEAFRDDCKDGYIGVPHLDDSNYFNKISTTYSKEEIIIRYTTSGEKYIDYDPSNESNPNTLPSDAKVYGVTYNESRNRWETSTATYTEMIGVYEGYVVTFAINMTYHDRLSLYSQEVFDTYNDKKGGGLAQTDYLVALFYANRYNSTYKAEDCLTDQGEGYFTYAHPGQRKSDWQTEVKLDPNKVGSLTIFRRLISRNGVKTASNYTFTYNVMLNRKLSECI